MRREVRNIVGHPTALPSVAQLAPALRTDMNLAELETYYSEDNVRKAL